ncbi:MAG: hypothetical protein ACOC4J_01660 [Bacteroidota bacterium]
MANLRDLKKDINFLTDEVIEACFLQKHLGKKDQNADQEINKWIEEVVATRNDLINKINNPDEEDKKKLKKFYRGIRQEMISKAEEIFQKMEKTEA